MLATTKIRNQVENPNKIFAKDLNTVERVFLYQRKQLAAKLGNPRLEQIHFHSIRH